MKSLFISMVLLFGFVNLAHGAQGLKPIESGVAEAVNNYWLAQSPVGEANVFALNVKQVCHYAKFSPLSLRGIIRTKRFTFEWISPSGEVFRSFKTAFAFGTNDFVSDCIPVNNAVPATLPGHWTVRLYDHGAVIDEKNFSLGALPSTKVISKEPVQAEVVEQPKLIEKIVQPPEVVVDSNSNENIKIQTQELPATNIPSVSPVPVQVDPADSLDPQSRQKMERAVQKLKAMKEGSNDSTLGVLFLLAVLIVMVIGIWKMGVKAGYPGWKMFVPIYSVFIYRRIANVSIWWVFLSFVPVINFISLYYMSFQIAKRFGRGLWFATLLSFVPFIMWPVLGFGKYKYSTTLPGSVVGSAS